jgi:hypothetical protein
MIRIVIWTKFECTKCVHVSTFGFFDSMMFYKIRGFQRLHIYNFLDTWFKRYELNKLTEGLIPI